MRKASAGPRRDGLMTFCWPLYMKGVRVQVPAPVVPTGHDVGSKMQPVALGVVVQFVPGARSSEKSPVRIFSVG